MLDDLSHILPPALLLALDDFVESEHPRGPGGQFSKGGGGPTPAPHLKPGDITGTLSKAGYKTMGTTKTGFHKYQHSSGKTIYVGQGKNEKLLKGWSAGGGENAGYGAKSLAEHLEKKDSVTFTHPLKVYQDLLANSTPIEQNATTQYWDTPAGTLQIEKDAGPTGHTPWKLTDQDGKSVSGAGMHALQAQMEKAPEAKPSASPAKVHKHVADRAAAAGFKPGGKTINDDDRFTFHDDKGKLQESVVVNPDTGEWKIWKAGDALVGKPGANQLGTGFAVSGKGTAAFDALFEGLHPRGAGGQFVAKPNGPENYVSHKDVGVQVLLNLAGAKLLPAESGYSSKLYALGDSGIIVRLPDEENPNFGVFKDGVAVGPGTEKGAAALSERIQEAGLKFSPAAAAPAATPKPPLTISALKQVGPALGSNPGGQYEDDAGQKYYVKQTQSEDHARNERLAASLYELTGANTLTYRASDDPKAVVTEMVQLEASNVAALTPAQRKAAQADFAAHAWLANWDAVGTGGDNLGAAGGKPINLDLGGSLAYRAKGAPKGAAFGNEAGEWTTLRDKNKNYDAGQLFGDMTPDELKASAARVAKVSDDQIVAAVKAAGYPDDEAYQLAAKLSLRRDSVAKQAGDAEAKTKTPSQLREEIAALSPPRSHDVDHAIESYKGSGYTDMNACMRFFVGCEDKRNTAIEKYLEKTSLPAATLYRGIRSDYTNLVMPHLKEGRVLNDAGFVSTSTDRDFSKNWAGSGGMLMEITVPAGSRGAAVRGADSSDSEYEILLQRNSRFVVESVDFGNKIVKVRLDHGHMETNNG